jgi:hypothetical protein
VYAWVRHLVFAAVFGVVAAWAAPAAAWIELTPKGLLSTVEVEPDGHATVSHELTLEVRGGPLKTLEFGSADADAELLPDATVTKVPAGLPIPLIVERRADGSLGLEIDLPKGVRGGTYLFKVRYRTNLVARGLLHSRGSAIELGWVGPRLEAGIDGARVVFRLPPSETAPRLPLVASDEPDPGFGVMVSAIHHTPAADEIELVRSHVARGEPVLWRVEAGAGALTLGGAATPAVTQPRAPVASPLPPPHRSLRWPLIAAAFALVLGSLTALKARAVAAACRARRAAARPLVPLAVWWRSPLAALALGAGLAAGNELEEPTLAVLGILVAMACVTERGPKLERTPRGPGRWLSLRDEDAFELRREVVPGAWLDAGTLRGLLVLVASIAAVTALALGELGRSPFRALLLALGGAAFMPLFFTGRASELLRDRVQFSRIFMRDLARALRRKTSAKVVAWGRVPDGSSEPDELRVLVQPKDCLPGLVALETGLDAQRGLGGIVGVPFVIVRAKEGSPAQRALPRGVIWARGRRADERVAILSPKLPTLALSVALVERLLAELTDQAPSSRRMSSGRSAFTAKLGSVRSPAHAT